MINVIIIDDEYLIRERIKKCVDWNALGYQIMAEASNGADALKLAEEMEQGVAIVDIHMPKVDGLKFAEIVRGKFPNIRVVILTGYNKFDYAREAIRAGAADYLLKPVNGDEIKNILQKLKQEIQSDAMNRVNLAKATNALREVEESKKEKFIRKLLDGSYKNDESWNEKIQKYCPKLTNNTVSVCLVHFDQFPFGTEEDKKLWKFTALNIINELSDNYNNKVISTSHDDRLVLIINSSEGDALSESLEILCNKAQQAVEKLLNFTITLGIGDSHEGYDGIQFSYREAVIAISNRFFSSGNCVIPFVKLESANKPVLEKELKLFKINLRKGDFPEIYENIDRIISKNLSGKFAVEHLTFVLTELLSSLSDFLFENNMSMMELTDENLNVYEVLKEYEFINELRLWIKNVCSKVLNVMGKGKVSNSRKLAEKAQDFIKNNYYNEDLTLNDIAKFLSINSSHLSNIFSNETGVTISEFLRECRMLKAKELLDKGAVSIYGVSEAVGFSDAQYFSKCFKKAFGVSPTQYIELKVY